MGPLDWLEVSAATAGEHVEEVYAALSALAPGGCSIEEPLVPLGPEEGVRHEPWRPTVLRIYLPRDAEFDERRAATSAALQRLSFPVDVTEHGVREEDWANAWKEFFQVERLGRRLVIRPTWREYRQADDEVVVDLDPGMAFGTGQHETTRMCLLELEPMDLSGKDVLDLGCGSGILAVAAAKLGARTVTAVDVESTAVEATTANAFRNRIDETVRVAQGSLGERWPFSDAAENAFDVVLANIHAGALQELAGDLHRALRPGGRLIGSGIIAERAADVDLAFFLAGLDRLRIRGEGEWRTIIAHRLREMA
jgi:ribosomal protein L11 methyltransferase